MGMAKNCTTKILKHCTTKYLINEAAFHSEIFMIDSEIKKGTVTKLQSNNKEHRITLT